MLSQAINPVRLISQKDLERYLQKQSSQKNIVKEEFLKGAAYELELLKQSSLEKEARYLKHLENQLRALNKKSNSPLEEAEILEITKSAESFNKYFQEESRSVWNGMLEELKKQGANQSFIEGMQKEASAARIFAALANPFKRFGRFMKGSRGKAPAAAASQAAQAAAPAAQAAQAAASPSSGGFEKIRFSPTKGMAGLGTGALTGAMLGGVPGALIGGGIGGTVGLLGPVGGGAAILGGLGYGGYRGLKATGLLGQGDDRDMTGELEDRNRLVPMLSNQFLGGAGGAILGKLIASEAGLQGGPMGLLAPVLGGIAGYNYLPQMMNKWKDPVGVGANRISPWAAENNRRIIAQ